MWRGGLRGGLLALGLMVWAGAGCARTKCTSSAECGGGQICGAPGDAPFQCLRACMTDADCGAGRTCTPVTSADCTECELSLACVPVGADAASQ